MSRLQVPPGAPILVRTPNWVGDAVMALPFFDALRHNFPRSPVTALARPHAADIAGLAPGVEVIVHDDRGLTGATVGRVAAARELARRRFAVAFLLPNSFSAALVPFLARIPVRVGYSKDARGLLLTHPLPWDRQARGLHRSRAYLELLARLGLDVPPDPRPSVRLPDALVAEAERLLQAAGIGARERLAAVAPGAVGASRRWPPERFGDVARTLAERLRCRVVILGGPGDRAAAETVWRRAGPAAVNLAGAARLALLPALIARCDALVSNDSGAAHVASLTDTPTLVLFGAGNETITRPLGPSIHILRVHLDCTPCESNSCARGDLACMTALDAPAVAAAVLRLTPDEASSLAP